MDPKIIEYKNDVLENRATLVITNLNEVRIYHQSGIKDAYSLKRRAENLNGFIAVEKVSGKASISLLYSMGVREIHSLATTNDALEFSKTLEGLEFTYDQIISSIKDEDVSDEFQIEDIIKDLNTVPEINNKIKETILKLKEKEGTGTIVIK